MCSTVHTAKALQYSSWCVLAVWSESMLFTILSASFGCVSVWQNHTAQILEWLEHFFFESPNFEVSSLVTPTPPLLRGRSYPIPSSPTPWDKPFILRNWSEPEHNKTFKMTYVSSKTACAATVFDERLNCPPVEAFASPYRSQQRFLIRLHGRIGWS